MSGEVNWIELAVEDTARARAFFGGLFGWRTNEFEGDYHVIDGGPPGALAPKGAYITHNRIYLNTDDIDAAAKRVRELGGTTEDVVAMPGVGRIAHCQDDQATQFSLFEPAPEYR